jgi:hypothetical protein
VSSGEKIVGSSKRKQRKRHNLNLNSGQKISIQQPALFFQSDLLMENESNRKVKRSELQNENPNSNKCPKPRILKQFCVQSPPSPLAKKQALSSSSQKQALQQTKPQLVEDSITTAAFTPYARKSDEVYDVLRLPCINVSPPYESLINTTEKP